MYLSLHYWLVLIVVKLLSDALHQSWCASFSRRFLQFLEMTTGAPQLNVPATCFWSQSWTRRWGYGIGTGAYPCGLFWHVCQCLLFQLPKNNKKNEHKFDIFERYDLLGNHSLALDRKKVWYANGLEYGAVRGYVLVPSQIHIYHICQRKINFLSLKNGDSKIVSYLNLSVAVCFISIWVRSSLPVEVR